MTEEAPETDISEGTANSSAAPGSGKKLADATKPQLLALLTKQVAKVRETEKKLAESDEQMKKFKQLSAKARNDAR